MKRAAHATELRVSMDGLPVGTLVSSREGKIYFAYDVEWMDRGSPLSPMPAFALQLPPFHAVTQEFGGLHGVFHDALPDGWGLLLMDRELKQTAGWDPHEINPLDRLSYMGARAMGALEFKPVMESGETDALLSIAALAEAAIQVEEGSPGEVIRSLHLQGGSPGGARPKITLAISADGSQCQSGFKDTPAGYNHWIIKFRARAMDPLCSGRIEMAYADMARAAGLVMPDTTLMTATVHGQAEDYFAVKRFDREGNKKRHILSVGGLLEASHRVPSIDYDTLLQAVGFATRDAREVEKAFRQMVFNVLAHNKDDHVKNFALLWTGTDWAMSPAYDLTFNAGLNNQHMTAINGCGNPGLTDVLTIGKRHGVRSSREIVEEVLAAVIQWPEYAAQWAVEPALAANYQRALLDLPCRRAL